MNSLHKQLLARLCSGALGVAAMSMPAHALDDVLDTPSELSEKASQTLLLDIDSAGDKLVAVGHKGHILVSSDSGQSWSQSSVPVSVLLTGVDFVDGKQGWAVGHGGVILRSIDGGSTWTKQFDGDQANQLIIEQAEAAVARLEAEVEAASEDDLEDLEYELEDAQFALEDAQADAEVGASKPLLDVMFLNAKEGFSVGAYGFIFKTENGGQSWVNYGDRMDNPDRFHLNAIAKIEGGSLLIAGEAGVLFRSDDNGESWETVYSPYEGSFFGITPTMDEDTVLVHGLRGNLFRSEDAGQNWEEVESNTEGTLMSGGNSPSGDISIVGNSGVVIFSDDGGKTFKETIRPDRLGNASLVYTKRRRMVVVGESGVSLTDAKGQNL